MSWEENILSSLCFKITDGTHDSPKSVSNGFPYIKGTQVKNGLIDFDNCEYLNKEDHLKVISRSKPEKGDTLFANIGANIGECAYVNVDFEFSIKNVALFKPDSEYLNGKFLYYLLSSDLIQRDIKNRKSGSAQPFLSLKLLRSYKITYPPIQTQKRIADILSAYDELIENNLKRIKLLERVAQNIYKEWFVNMRFPGHENTPINSETGLPEGWLNSSVNEYIEVASKGPSLDYNTDSGIPVLNQSCIRNGEIELDRVRYAKDLNENKEYCYLEINDILINSMGQGTLGRVSKNNSINSKYIIHNCISFLRSKDLYSQAYLYYFIKSKENYFISVSQGSTGQTTLKLKLITDLEINIPSFEILKSFDDIVLPMWSQIGLLKNSCEQLKKARDILLPRLMNQTIKV